MNFYAGLKDFAGPVATVIASMVAGVFAYRQWLTARSQADIALSKLKFDTFAARHDVPTAAYELVKYILSQNLRFDHVEFVRECINRIEQGRYYFPNDIINELDIIIIKSRRLENYYVRLESAPFLVRKSIKDNVDKLENELASRVIALPKIFEPYLSIDLLSKPRKFADFTDRLIIILYSLIILEAIIVMTMFSFALPATGR